LSGFFGCVACC